MPVIKLKTIINAPIEICFDLSRSIDLHQLSTAKTKEVAIAGVTKGLISGDEMVTWEATHFGIRQKLTSKITVFQPPCHFRDEQIKGIFKMLQHDHYFVSENSMTVMTDNFYFESPFGILGQLFNKMILTNYLRKFITDRNKLIKAIAESGKWKDFIL